MSEEIGRGQEGAVELLALHDRLDRCDELLRVQRTVLRLTPLVSGVLAVPLLVVLFLNEVRFFLVYPLTFVIVLGAILWALTLERGRRKAEREAIRARIRQIERLA